MKEIKIPLIIGGLVLIIVITGGISIAITNRTDMNYSDSIDSTMSNAQQSPNLVNNSNNTSNANNSNSSNRNEAESSDENADYTDGTYSASGSYFSPGGSEEIDIEVTIADGIIVEASATPTATLPQSLRYQNLFADGISGVAVGEPITSDINQSSVNGSSLTLAGFNDALEEVRAQARV